MHKFKSGFRRQTVGNETVHKLGQLYIKWKPKYEWNA